MRFMAMVMHKEDYSSPNGLADEAAMLAMGKFNEELVKAGVMLTGEGLHPTAKGARVVYTHGQRQREVVDGPYSEAREVIGGFWMLDVKDKDEAIAWMKRAPFHHDAVVEIRQVQELSDFEDSPAIRRERALGEKIKAQNEVRAEKK